MRAKSASSNISFQRPVFKLMFGQKQFQFSSKSQIPGISKQLCFFQNRPFDEINVISDKISKSFKILNNASRSNVKIDLNFSKKQIIQQTVPRPKNSQKRRVIQWLQVSRTRATSVSVQYKKNKIALFKNCTIKDQKHQIQKQLRQFLFNKRIQFKLKQIFIKLVGHQASLLNPRIVKWDLIGKKIRWALQQFITKASRSAALYGMKQFINQTAQLLSKQGPTYRAFVLAFKPTMEL